MLLPGNCSLYPDLIVHWHGCVWPASEKSNQFARLAAFVPGVLEQLGLPLLPGTVTGDKNGDNPQPVYLKVCKVVGHYAATKLGPNHGAGWHRVLGLARSNW